MARSTNRSNQRPDTLMQDRNANRSTKPSCNARPDHTLGQTAKSSRRAFVFRSAPESRPRGSSPFEHRRQHGAPLLGQRVARSCFALDQSRHHHALRGASWLSCSRRAMSAVGRAVATQPGRCGEYWPIYRVSFVCSRSS